MSLTETHILVVDDEIPILEVLRKIFLREGYLVDVTTSGKDALDIIRAKKIDVVLTDIMMPKMSGIDLLRAVKAISPAIEVVMMTAYGTIENAVECMREGANNFIIKPPKRAIILSAVARAIERRALLRENQILRDAVAAVEPSDIIGQSRALHKVLELVTQAAPSQATILMAGESGTGKELLVRRVHRLSERAHGPFVAVNCGSLSENLLEAELFGSEKGAYTGATSRRLGRFERADGGTLFLDEIGETSAAVQVRLLRALQEGEIERLGGEKTVPVDVRVVAATNRNLLDDVKAGRFREDLYYRLNVISVDVPPLRQRHGDVALLASYFLSRFSEKNKKTMRGFSTPALIALDAYDWPGNVRELENCIERAVVLCRSEVVGIDDLPAVIMASCLPAAKTAERISQHEENNHGEGIFVPYGCTMNDIKRRVIEATMRRTGGNKKTAARLLDIAPRTITRSLEE